MSENNFAEGVVCGQGMNNGCNSWGSDWIALIFLAAIFGGGGFGWGGGGGANVFGEVQRGFDTTGINNKLNGLENGLCDGFYAQLNGFAGVSREIASCCCETNRNIDQLRFDTERQHCETRRAIDANTDRILGYLTNQEMDRLRAENQALRFNASQAAQNAYLIGELRPTAKPAYLTCSPFSGAYGWNNGGNACGCGCG